MLPLPELIARQGDPDVIVKTGHIENGQAIPEDRIEWGWATPRDIVLHWKGIGTLRVSEGKEITVDCLPGSRDTQIRFLILNRGLPAILHQRSCLILHGSVVAVHQNAVVFLGESQEGKSTLAAFLHRRGHGLMADDLAAIRTDAHPPIAYPGFPEMRLWPDTLSSLGEMPEEWPSVPHRCHKRTRLLQSGFADSVLPLQKIYVLAEGSTVRISLLSPREAFLVLIRHSLAGGLLESSQTSSAHLLHCVSLIRNIPICRFERPRSLAALPESAKLIESDLGEYSCQASRRLLNV